MKTKKEYSAWRIATSHWFVAGIIAVIFQLIYTALTGYLYLDCGFGGLINQSICTWLIPSLTMIGYIIVPVLAIWLGVKLSSYRVNKYFIVKDIRKVINIATTLTALSILVYVESILTAIGDMEGEIVNLELAVYGAELAGLILTVVVFYFASKKYIKISDSLEPGPQDFSQVHHTSFV